MKAVFIGIDTKVIEVASISVRLRWPDAQVTVATTGASGLESVERASPEVVLLHPDFSDMSLAKTIRELRGFSAVPLIVLGHTGDEMEAVTALETGADDYIRLPCDLTEIMARVWALLRRVSPGSSKNNERPLHSGRLLINPAAYEVFLGEKRVTVTSTEFRLLYLLVANRGMVVSHQTLEWTIWGDQANTSGLAKKYIQRLRLKLGDDAREPRWIASVHGVGYRFIGPAPGPETMPAKAVS